MTHATKNEEKEWVRRVEREGERKSENEVYNKNRVE